MNPNKALHGDGALLSWTTRSAAMAVLTVFLGCVFAVGQDAPKLNKTVQEKIKKCRKELDAALLAENESKVKRTARQINELLGDQAGLPETADECRPVAQGAAPLSRAEIDRAYDPYIVYIERQRWWRIGMDPSKAKSPMRDVASMLEGCLTARAVSQPNDEKLLALATEAGDFLVWAQDEAGAGVIPFPAVRNGKSRALEVGENLCRQAEKSGKFDQMVRKGWLVEDFGEGGLQFDNGLAGVALIHLFEATKDEKYRKAAVRAADWAAGRRMVMNWNYNSFSLFLLSETYRITGEKKYLEAAKKKARIGVLPGQLTEGPRQGRWADPHNARPPYHYIMIRGLAALAAVLPKGDPSLAPVVKSLQLALNARNPDFQRGIINVDSATEALVKVKSLPPEVAQKIGDCGTDEALGQLERYAATGLRAGKKPLEPGTWGQLLAYLGTKDQQRGIP